jgi:hypothetical protein
MRCDEMRGRYTLLIIIVVDQRERDRCIARKKETVWQMRRIFLLGDKRVSRCAQLPEGCSLPGIQIPRLTLCLSIFCNCDCVNAESSAIVQVRVSFMGISLCSLTGDPLERFRNDGDRPSEDLAKSGYKPNVVYKSF